MLQHCVVLSVKSTGPLRTSSAARRPEGEDKKKDEMEDDKGWDEDLDDIYLYG